MTNGASGAVSDAAPYAFIVYIVLLDSLHPGALRQWYQAPSGAIHEPRQVCSGSQISRFSAESERCRPTDIHRPDPACDPRTIRFVVNLPRCDHWSRVASEGGVTATNKPLLRTSGRACCACERASRDHVSGRFGLQQPTRPQSIRRRMRVAVAAVVL